MSHALVITVVGPDRPGIVGRVADVVAAHDADWLESHMANIAGQFAGIVHVNVAAEREQALITALQAIADSTLAVTVAKAGAPTDAGVASTPRLTLELTGLDHPGIVRDIGLALADLGVSVESLETDRHSGSMSGEMMFVARATLVVPEGVSVEAVDEALQSVSAGLMVDVVVEDVG